MLWLHPIGWDPRDCAALRERYGRGAIEVYRADGATSAVEPTLSAIYWVVAGRPPEQEELDANEIIWGGLDFGGELNALERRLLAICGQIVRGELLLSLQLAQIHYVGEEIIGHHLRQYSTRDYSLQPSEAGRPGDSWEIRIDFSENYYAFEAFLEGGRKTPMNEARWGFHLWLQELIYDPRYFRDAREAFEDRDFASWRSF